MGVFPPVLNYAIFDFSTVLRSFAWFGLAPSVVSTVQVGSSLLSRSSGRSDLFSPALGEAHLGFFLLLRGFSRLSSMSPVLVHLKVGTSTTTRSLGCSRFFSPAFGNSCLGLLSLMLDFSNFNLPLSSRGVTRPACWNLPSHTASQVFWTTTPGTSCLWG